MDALIKISSSEFNEEVFKKIKALLSSFGNSEVTIAVSNRTDGIFRKETESEYWNRIQSAITDLENGKGIVFTMDELKAFAHNAPAE